MKEFAVYTLLRIGLFLGALAIVVGIWSLFSDGVPILLAIIAAFLISGVASYFLLNTQRELFARRVQNRASRAAEKIEEMRRKEDAEDDVQENGRT